MTGVARVGVSFPPQLLGELDDVVQKVGYPNRSRAIQDSVRSLVTRYRLLREERGSRTGVIALVYDHESRGLEDYLTDTQHEYAPVVCSSTHVHLSKRDCLEVLVVRGEATIIRELVDRLHARRGVRQVELTVVSS
jgi:CopG family nickel-responsive transcriptional regulator